MPGFIAAIPSSLYRHSPPLSTIILPVPHRHSRVSGNPGILAGNRLVFSVPFGIPAYAGMTVREPATGGSFRYRSGFPLTRE